MMEEKQMMLRQLELPKSDFVAESMRRDRGQYNRNKHGWTGRDGSILVLGFCQPDQSENTVETLL